MSGVKSALLVGVGVATSVETAALLSKKALMRPLGSHNENERAAYMEKLLEDGINSVEVKRHCIKNHFLVTAIGTNIIRMVPPLTIRAVDCDEAVARLSKSINEVAEGK